MKLGFSDHMSTVHLAMLLVWKYPLPKAEATEDTHWSHHKGQITNSGTQNRTLPLRRDKEAPSPPGKTAAVGPGSDSAGEHAQGPGRADTALQLWGEGGGRTRESSPRGEGLSIHSKPDQLTRMRHSDKSRLPRVMIRTTQAARPLCVSTLAHLLGGLFCASQGASFPHPPPSWQHISTPGRSTGRNQPGAETHGKLQ